MRFYAITLGKEIGDMVSYKSVSDNLRLSRSLISAGVIAAFLAAPALAGDLSPDAVRRVKKATCLFVNPKLQGIGHQTTAFCIDRSGIFVISAWVAKAAGTNQIDLVVEPDSDKPRTLKGRVARIDDAFGLALIKAEKAEGLECLELGKLDNLYESASVTAFGYSDRLLGRDKPEFPPITALTVRVAALPRKNGELERIQFDGPLYRGNFAGPLIDSEGRLVGIVEASSSVNAPRYAIPVNRLETMLARPEITVSAPTVLARRQHEPQGFTVHMMAFQHPSPESMVELTLSTGSDDQRVQIAKVAGDTARFTIVPVPRFNGPKPLRVTATFSDGSIVGRVADRDIRMSGKTKLSEISDFTANGKGDAARLEGTIHGLDHVVMNLGGGTVAVDLGKATAITVENLVKPVCAIEYKVRIRNGPKLVAEAAGAMDVIGTMPPPAPAAQPGVANLESDRAVRSLPAPIDDVVAGGAGRYLILHLRKLHELAIFDVGQARITKYLPYSADDILYAAGSDKLLIAPVGQSVIERYDLATLRKEITVHLSEVGKLHELVLGNASAGPIMLNTQSGVKFLDLGRLAPVTIKTDQKYVWWRAHPQYPLQVRASPDGDTFAAWEPGLNPSGIRLMTLDGDKAFIRYEHTSAGVLIPSYDGSLLFTNRGIYSADLQPVAPELKDMQCFPSYLPAFFLGIDGPAAATGNPKLCVYATNDKRMLVSFTEFSELGDSPGSAPLTIDKRAHFFPLSNLLVIIPASRRVLGASSRRRGGRDGEGRHRLLVRGFAPAYDCCPRQRVVLRDRRQITPRRRPLRAEKRSRRDGTLRRWPAALESARNPTDWPPRGESFHHRPYRKRDHAHLRREREMTE
jgi:hypothetical protein